jgi:hypothetical protein
LASLSFQSTIAAMAKMRERQGRTDYAYAVIALTVMNPELNGKTIPEAAQLLMGKDTLNDQIETILDLEARGGASAIFHSMNEEDLQALLEASTHHDRQRWRPALPR